MLFLDKKIRVKIQNQNQKQPRVEIAEASFHPAKSILEVKLYCANHLCRMPLPLTKPVPNHIHAQKNKMLKQKPYPPSSCKLSITMHY